MKKEDEKVTAPFDDTPGLVKASTSTADDYEAAIWESNRRIADLMTVKGIPGLTISVAQRGKIVWKTAFGFCDVENQLSCDPDAQMRIASISKSIFAASIVGAMLEADKIDLKSSIYKYLSEEEFPKKEVNGKRCDITIEQLLSHTSGIRHYNGPKDSEKTPRPIGSKKTMEIYQGDDQIDRVEFYQRKTYRNVMDALEMFKNDPLVHEPGKYLYTTYGYTLLSAVMQKALQVSGDTSDQIEDHWIQVLRNSWKLHDTHLDHDEVIISKRAKYYLRTGLNGQLINAPYTDSSNKWAAGGLVSNTSDLVKFAQRLIDCYKERNSPILKRNTIQKFWQPVSDDYGLGFNVIDRRDKDGGEKLVVLHTGGALGASTVLVIYPESEIVVAILTNLYGVNLKPLGLFVADQFNKVN